MFTIRISCVVLAVSIAHLAVADTIELERSSAISLSSLIQNVFEHHPARQLALAHQQKINANTDVANALFADPISASVEHFNDGVGSSDGFQEWQGGIEIPLWLPGQKQQQLNLSEIMSAQLPAERQQLLLEISAEIRELVWQVSLTEVVSQQAYQTWQSAKKLEQDVNVRVDAGDLAGSEGLLARTYTLDMHSRYLAANSELQYQLAHYQYRTNENVLPENYQEALSPKTTIDANHPSLAALEQHIVTLQTKQRLARYDNAANPTLSVGVRRERGDSNEDFNNSLGLGFSFALGGDVYRQPAIANAAMDLADIEIAHQQLERHLNIILSEQRHQLSAQQQQLVLLDEHHKTTQQYVLLQQRAFDLGEIDLVSLLNSQKLANESLNRRQLLEVNIQYTTVKVNQALGIIPH